MIEVSWGDRKLAIFGSDLMERGEENFQAEAVPQVPDFVDVPVRACAHLRSITSGKPRESGFVSPDQLPHHTRRCGWPSQRTVGFLGILLVVFPQDFHYVSTPWPNRPFRRTELLEVQLRLECSEKKQPAKIDDLSRLRARTSRLT